MQSAWGPVQHTNCGCVSDPSAVDVYDADQVL